MSFYPKKKRTFVVAKTIFKLMQMNGNKVLEIENLTVDFYHEGSFRTVVKGVSYSVERGKTLGIVGESGSGKSVSSMAVMGLLPGKAKCRVAGNIWYYTAAGERVDLLSLTDSQMRHYRGRHISMIFQEPMTSLNPVHTCGEQIIEVLQTHQNISHGEAYAKALKLMEEVLIPRPEKIMKSFPHQVSGGQKQRVMIAMALACNPDVLIADEPTTALDVTVQKTILELLANLQQKYGMAIIFITHDLGVIANIAHDVAVLYKGEVVEHKPAKELFYNPSHPYTKGLLACRPPLDCRPIRLYTVADYLGGNAVDNPPCETAEQRSLRHRQIYSQPPILSVNDLEVTYPLKKSITGKVLQSLTAVDKVSFDVYRGETLGLVGESGCGKTTLGRALMRLIDKSSGSITFDGTRLDLLNAKQMRMLRPMVQIIFQDPYSSLNPRITVGDAIMEPLRVWNKGGNNNRERREYVLNLMKEVGLDQEHYNRYPHEFSGGQRQRVCIARALALKPSVVVCDESVSALDVSVQAQVLNLLNDLKNKWGFTYIFISHDLSVVKFLADRLMIMRQGKVVEMGDADAIYANPQQEYTRNLIEAIPKVEASTLDTSV